MIPAQFLQHLWHHDKKHLALCLLTALVCTFADPVVGILIGTLIGYLLGAMSSTQIQNTLSVVNTRDAELAVRTLVR
jgi:MFS superfamily sulfate permease-like transporter